MQFPRPFTVVSLFSGAGGFDLGFQQEGFDVIWANDFDKDSCETHKSWSIAEIIQGDIRKIPMGRIPYSDIIIGGFPCQGFSLAGPRKIDDSRNSLYKSFVDIVFEKQPLCFVAENVSGILSLGDGLIIDAIIQDFSSKGYDVNTYLVNAKDYDVPQDRKRVFIIGFRKDLKNNNAFVFPTPSSNKVDLSVIKNLDIPISSKNVCPMPFSSRYMSRNRKRNWDQVSFTIPAMAKQIPLHPSSPNMIQIHKELWSFGDGYTRRLSWEESAIIQTFPIEIDFKGNLTSKYKQIGNAVPPKLASHVARSIQAFLSTKNHTTQVYSNFTKTF